MPRLTTRNPAYRHHRPSGQATVRLSGQDFYLGPYGTQRSKAEYDRVVGEWITRGRQPTPAIQTAPATVSTILAAYWQHAEGYYTRGGELGSLKSAMAVVRRLYGPTPAGQFGPLALQSVRDEFAKRGWCRGFINSQVQRVKHLFKWAVSRELVPAGVYHGLLAVDGLRRGRCSVREAPPVLPVDEQIVQAVIPFCPPPIAALVQLQLLTGARPGELIQMRTIDIDRETDKGPNAVWTYRPPEHKTEYRGHERIIYFGPQAQEVLAPWLKMDPNAFIFSPAESERRRREAMHAARQTPLSCGNRPGSNRKRKPRRQPGNRYSSDSYARAIARACDKADAWHKGGRVIGDDERVIPRWHPHQLRHTAATELRKTYGLEAAQVILGHRTLTVTQVYAERNIEAAKRIMAAVG